MTIAKFTTTPQEFDLIEQVCARYATLALEHGFKPYDDHMSRVMDLSAVHSNGNPMDFEKLLAAPEFDFMHDIDGIMRHLDRNTGTLQDFFSPRCSLPEGSR